MRRILLAVLALALIGASAFAYWAARPSGPAIADLAKRPSVTDPKAPSSRIISREDLPPAGTRSLFDHLVAEAGGVPYPFEKLVAALSKADPQGQEPLQLLIPDGRSLLKAQANFEHPRVLFAADYVVPNAPGGLGVAPRGQLFLGFTERANEIEVISYNELAGRFEFQLVQNYSAKGARKLVYAKRAICESCHQGGPPIFSQRPWNETNGQPDTAAKIASALAPSCPGGAQCPPAPTRYQGVPLTVPLSVPERFDELTDTGSFLVAAQKLWLDACTSISCRRTLLTLALRYAQAPGRFDDASADVAAYKKLLAPVTVALPESDLANRDPLGEAKGIKGYFRQLFKPKVKLGDGAKTNEDLAAFDKLPKLPAAQDPLSARPAKRQLGAQDPDGIYGIAAMFTAEDAVTLSRAAGSWLAVEAAVQALPEALFVAKPFSRVLAMQALLAQLHAGAALGQYPYLDTAELSPPVASGEPPVKLAAKSPIQPFADHCFACHRGNPSKRLNFMRGATEAEVSANIKAKGEIRDALDWPRYQGSDKANKLMPPADSVQRAEVQAELQSNPQLLEQMRAVVPGLFDF